MDVRTSTSEFRKKNYFLTEIEIFLQKEDTQSAIDKFVEGIDLFYAIAVAPHKNMHVAEESLKACYADQGTVVSMVQQSES